MVVISGPVVVAIYADVDVVVVGVDVVVLVVVVAVIVCHKLCRGRGQGERGRGRGRSNVSGSWPGVRGVKVTSPFERWVGQPTIGVEVKECLVVPSKWLREVGMYLDVLVLLPLSIGTLHCVVPLHVVGSLLVVGG